MVRALWLVVPPHRSTGYVVFRRLGLPVAPAPNGSCADSRGRVACLDHGGPGSCRTEQGGPSGRMDAVADDILELQRAFDDAELRGDAERLGGLLADDFLSIGEQGYQLGKQEWIGRHGEFRYLSIETTEVDVRRYDKTAIVRCVQRSRATWRGEPMALAVRLSQVWIWRPGGWQLAAIQFSTLGSG
jgi:hypothetical protein